MAAPPGSPRYGSCLFSLKLRFFRMRATPFSAPPAFGSYCPGPLIPPAGGPRMAGLTPRLGTSPCVPRLRSRDLWTAFRWSDTVRNNPPHWLTVATAGLVPDCVRLRRWKPHPRDVTRLAAGLGCRPHFLHSCCQAPPLAARLPVRISGKVRPLPGEPVTCASGGILPLPGGFRRGRERQFLPTIFPGLRPVLSRGGFRFRERSFPPPIFCQRSTIITPENRSRRNLNFAQPTESEQLVSKL